ncbi:MAG: metalloregulator ArsR/SmtB family transcription factor [Pirellulales bacterium]
MITTMNPRESNELESSQVAGVSLPDVPEAMIKDLVKVFKLLSDETRMHILLFLTRTPELHVRALCEMLGQSQPAVSHHLALLKAAEIIDLRREGKHNYYRLVPQRFQQVLDLVFDGTPADKRRIRFEDYVLSYSPQRV